MEWNAIIFNDESNPYICKTKTEFKKMMKKYKLEPSETKNFWIAKEEIKK